MADCGLLSDEAVSKLTEMGFEFSAVAEAVKEVGPSLDDAVDYILNGPRRNCGVASSSSRSSSINRNGKRIKSSIPSLGRACQSSILDHFQSTSRLDNNVSDASCSRSEGLALPVIVNEQKESLPAGKVQACCLQTVNIGPDWEEKANSLLQKHFGYPSLKGFQKEALAAWVAHQDCLVLAATGSGKSLCFQIPALLTGKVVVVISPLISLMHDQCLKLSKHGVSACFLGSGQPDSSVEQKAMRGMYQIIYICPETVLRLMKPLQGLADSPGIALFAIDEVHCVSKWGHDFRPDYRRLSLLREDFSAIPLMALTATATIQVWEDIIKSLRMSEETKIVLTSFFRPNLRFSVKHSRTSSPSSYEKDFGHLIDMYSRKRKTKKKKGSVVSKLSNEWSDGSSNSGLSETEDYCSDTCDELKLSKENKSNDSKGKEMSVDYLENEIDLFQSVDDWDVACGEFCGQFSCDNWSMCVSSKTFHPPNITEERLKLLQKPLEEGPTIIYVRTRKETLSIANFLCGFGVKAAAYNASLPKSHLRCVHKEFHENILEVVVATIAFGMGIDKLNVRRVIHYGWPQSLEAYYQEAGRAGRDGKLAECTLYANLSRIPSLLLCKRSEDQTKQAYKMLSDCFRYGMNTSCCRAKMLVEYFAEDFKYEKCLLCDVCIDGPPKIQNLKEEADILMQIIASHLGTESLLDDLCVRGSNEMRKPNLRMYVSKIREQSQKFWATDQLWWQGLARIMEGRGYIREWDDKNHVQIKFPKPTKLGLEFLEFGRDQSFCVYPEADMLLSTNRHRAHSTFADWGKGWADPEIRRQRLESKQPSRKPRELRQTRVRYYSKVKPGMGSARGRIESKLSKQSR